VLNSLDLLSRLVSNPEINTWRVLGVFIGVCGHLDPE